MSIEITPRILITSVPAEDAFFFLGQLGYAKKPLENVHLIMEVILTLT